MDVRLKELFRRELAHLRSHAAEFARDGRFKDVAASLGLDTTEEARDPFVEWLLQGYAMLAARVQRRLEAEFPTFTEALLSVVHPHLTAPTPAMIVAAIAMKPDAALAETGVVLPRASLFELPRPAAEGTRRGPGDRPIRFVTGRALRLLPIEAKGLRYLEGAAAVKAAGASRPAPAAIAFELELTPPEASFGAFAPDHLDLHLEDRDGAGGALFEAVLGAALRVEEAGAGPGAPPLALAPLGFEPSVPCPRLGDEQERHDPADHLLPVGRRGFDGWRLLHEFMAFPDRFRFLRLSGLAARRAGREGRRLPVLILLDRTVPALTGTLPRDALRTNRVPAVNLFPMSANDVELKPNRATHPLTPDRRAADYEVHSVLSVTGVDARGGVHVVRPFFGMGAFGDRPAGPRRYWRLVRRARPRADLAEVREDALDLYAGSDARLAILDEGGVPAAGPVPRGREALRTLSVDVLCTNRHWVKFALGQWGAEARLDSPRNLGWTDVTVAAGPSPPRPGLPQGPRLWDAVNHLSLNHLSLVDSGDGRARDALAALIGLYAPEDDADGSRLIRALRGVTARPIVGPAAPLYARPGDAAAPMAFVRGIEAELRFDDASPEAAALALVLARVLAGQADANSFVETVMLNAADGRPRARFAPETGTRPAP